MLEQGLAWMALIWVGLNFAELIASKLGKTIRTELTCHKCLSWWITLAFTMDPFVAAIASISAFIFENKLKNIEL